MKTSSQPHWDIFCRVVDNFGDIGVCWRLARQLAAEHGLAVRLWVDDPASLAPLCPACDPSLPAQRIQGVEIRRWTADFAVDRVADVVIEAFACELPSAYVAQMAARPVPPCWINLEYLSAETWIEGCHGLASPHPSLPLVKYFFFPGFTTASGGLLREAGLPIAPPAAASDTLEISLFCYETAPVASLLQALAASPRPVLCHVPPGKPLAAVEAFLTQFHQAAGSLSIPSWESPPLPQPLPREGGGEWRRFQAPLPLRERGWGEGWAGKREILNSPETYWLAQRAHELREQQTPHEHALWQQLQAKRFSGYKFRRQQPLGHFIVDFVCFSRRLIVELDGGQHAEATEYDRWRDAWLKQTGFRVLRFWNNEWVAQQDAVLETIWRALQEPPPLPNPSPARGEGLEFTADAPVSSCGSDAPLPPSRTRPEASGQPKAGSAQQDSAEPHRGTGGEGEEAIQRKPNGSDAALGRPAAGWRLGNLRLQPLPFLPLDDYDALLRRCAINFVRGEDSFVRAQWAGRPFVWQIYPQDDAAHHVKLDAFLDRYCAALRPAAATAARSLFAAWNGGGDVGAAWSSFLAHLPETARHNAHWARQLAGQPDLATNLVNFAGVRV